MPLELFLAQAAPAASIAATAGGSALITTVRIAAGLGAGGILAWALRHKFVQWHDRFAIFRGAAHVAEKIAVFVVGILTGVFELWKRTSFETEDRFLLTIYIVVGFLSALAIALPLMTSTAKDNDKAKIKSLEANNARMVVQRDTSIEAVGAIGGVIEVKKQRLAQAIEAGAVVRISSVPDLLGPKVQILVLIKTLHQQFARHVPAPHKLRVGIYMRSPENAQVLAPLFSWDGTRENCFSHAHPGYMSLDAPGGAQSLVVQCFRSSTPMLMVANCEQAVAEERFVFFSPTQKNHLKSMVAYRYNVRLGGRPDALILTMDTDLGGFFSDDREFQCKLLLQETGRRLDLELISLDLIKKLHLPPTAHDRTPPS